MTYSAHDKVLLCMEYARLFFQHLSVSINGMNIYTSLMSTHYTLISPNLIAAVTSQGKHSYFHSLFKKKTQAD